MKTKISELRFLFSVKIVALKRSDFKTETAFLQKKTKKICLIGKGIWTNKVDLNFDYQD